MKSYYVYQSVYRRGDALVLYYANGMWTSRVQDATRFMTRPIARSVADRLRSNHVDAYVGSIRSGEPSLAPQGVK